MKKYILRYDDQGGQDAIGFSAYIKRPWLWIWGPFFIGMQWEPIDEHRVYGPKLVWMTRAERAAFREGRNFLTREAKDHVH